MRVMNYLERQVFLLITGYKLSNEEIRAVSSCTEDRLIKDIEFETSKNIYDHDKERTIQICLHMLGMRGSKKFPEFYDKYKDLKKKSKKRDEQRNI